jgi:hypothetical protein
MAAPMNPAPETLPPLAPTTTRERPINPVFSAELRTLADRFGGRSIRMIDLLEATQGRGLHLLLLLTALPFVGPIPLPGFSIPFGLLVTVLGGALAVGHKPWLPQAVLRRELPPQFLGRCCAERLD